MKSKLKERVEKSKSFLEKEFNMLTNINPESPVYNHYNKENFMSGYVEGFRRAIIYFETGE